MSNARSPISFIATKDARRARVFYEERLGLQLIETSPYALVFRDGSQMLRVQIVSDFEPSSYTAHGWQVTEIETEIKELTAKGIVFLKFEHLAQDAWGIWTTPEGAKIAWLKDPCGNILSLTQFK